MGAGGEHFRAAEASFRRARELQPDLDASARGWEAICRNGAGWCLYQTGDIAAAERAAALDAKRRFEAALLSAGPGLGDILWRIACAGEGMRDAETALGWPARSGKLVLTLALDRVADYYRIR